MKKYIVILFCFCIIQSTEIFSQTWAFQATPNPGLDEEFTDMIYMTHSTKSYYQIGSVGGRAAVRRIKSNGDIDWTKTYGPINSRFVDVDIQMLDTNQPPNRLILVGTIGEEGNGKTPDLLVTKITGGTGGIVFSTRLETSNIPSTTKISNPKICQAIQGGCWVGYLQDDSPYGTGTSDDIHLVNVSSNGIINDSRLYSPFINNNLIDMTFDRRNEQVLFYWKTNNIDKQHITSFDPAINQIVSNYRVPKPLGGSEEYAVIENINNGALQSDVILAGGNSLLHFDNDDGSSRGLREINFVTNISDLIVGQAGCAAYCDVTDRFFYHPYGWAKTGWENFFNFQPVGYEYDDRSLTNRISGLSMNNQTSLAVYSNEVGGVETYHSDESTMDDLCNISKYPMASKYYPIVLDSFPVGLTFTFPLNTDNMGTSFINDENFIEFFCSPLNLKESLEKDLTIRQSKSFKIYPNPTSQLLNIELNDQSDELFKIEIIDMTGKSVYSVNNLSSVTKTELNVSNYTPGIYILRISNSLNEVIKFDKIVIER